MRGIPANLVIADAIADHVHAHIRGRRIGRAAVDLLKHSVEHGENLNIAVVIDRGFPVSLQMEGINHVVIVQIDSRGLISDVDGMFQREIPNGERFKLGIASLHAALMLLIKLAEAYGHLAGARAGGSHQYQGAGRFNILVRTETGIGHDMLHIVGIALNVIMLINRNAKGLQALFEHHRGALFVPSGQHHAADIHADAAECVDQPQNVRVIRDSQISSGLVFLNVVRTDDNDQFGLLLEVQEH